MKLWNNSTRRGKIYKCNIFKGICICKRKEKCVIGRCITLSSESILTIAMVCIFSTLVLASVWPEVVEVIEDGNEEMWIPTKEDIEYQDSMYNIIQNTQSDVDTIKVQVQQIIERLDDFDE